MSKYYLISIMKEIKETLREAVSLSGKLLEEAAKIDREEQHYLTISPVFTNTARALAVTERIIKKYEDE